MVICNDYKLIDWEERNIHAGSFNMNGFEKSAKSISFANHN